MSTDGIAQHQEIGMTAEAGSNSKGQLRAIIERIQSVESDMRERADDRKEIYLEAKSAGFDVPSLRAIVKILREDATKRAAREAMLDVYKNDMGIE